LNNASDRRRLASLLSATASSSASSRESPERVVGPSSARLLLAGLFVGFVVVAYAMFAAARIKIAAYSAGLPGGRRLDAQA
jgi:hypothetical protein